MKSNCIHGPTLASLAAGLAMAVAFPVAAQQATPDRATEAKVETLMASAAAMPTPRSSDGHVELSGYWEPLRTASSLGGSNLGVPVAGALAPAANGGSTAKEIRVFPAAATVAAVNASDHANAAARKANLSLRPKYKPQFAAKAEENFNRGDLNDPTYGCVLPGVVRLGLPSEIFQRPGSVVLLYEGLVNRYRVIPTDGRKPVPDQDPLPMGHPIGHWDGNTLVIETSGFYGDYWLDKDGSYYSEDMKLTERLTRRGNTLRYEMVAEDPMFAAAFRPEPKTLVLAKDGTHVEDEFGCNERDLTKMTNGAKH